MHFFGTFPIAIRMAVHEDGLRAELGRGAQRHGGVHAKLAGLVRGGGNHAALVALPAHDYRFPLQLGIEQFFHGHKKGVHIDVEDRPGKAGHGDRYNSATHFTKMETGAIVESIANS